MVALQMRFINLDIVAEIMFEDDFYLVLVAAFEIKSF